MISCTLYKVYTKLSGKEVRETADLDYDIGIVTEPGCWRFKEEY